MALKGMTKIELTNVKTGEVETVEKHNMVTNALKSVLSNPFGWQTRSRPAGDTLAGRLIPICSEVIGGILLYESQIPEDPDQLYAQPGNVLVGYANNAVNDTDNTMRGSINANESGPLESGDGYRFVFDFATSQSNGTIWAVGLTSRLGGMHGPDSEYGKESNSTKWPNPNVLYEPIEDAEILKYMVTYDENSSTATAVRITTPGSVEISRIRFRGAKYWRLSGGTSLGDYIITEAKTIPTQFFGKKAAAQGSSGTAFYCNFCDDYNGHIWGFEHKDGAKGNASGKANINWIKIDIDTLNFEEGTWEIDAQLLQFGYYSTNGYITGMNTHNYPPFGFSAILDGWLYIFQYDLKKIIKVSLSNTTEIKFIDVPASCSFDGYKNVPKMCVFGNVLRTKYGYLNGETFVYTGSNAIMGGNSDNMDNCSGYEIGMGGRAVSFGTYAICAFSIDTNYSKACVSLRVVSAYLATINNLPAPVEKTADKTMKITYIIREEAET